MNCNMENTSGVSPPKPFFWKSVTLRSTTNIKFQAMMRKYIFGFLKGVVRSLTVGALPGIMQEPQIQMGTTTPTSLQQSYVNCSPTEVSFN